MRLRSSIGVCAGLLDITDFMRSPVIAAQQPFPEGRTDVSKGGENPANPLPDPQADSAPDE